MLPTNQRDIDNVLEDRLIQKLYHSNQEFKDLYNFINRGLQDGKSLENFFKEIKSRLQTILSTGVRKNIVLNNINMIEGYLRNEIQKQVKKKSEIINPNTIITIKDNLFDWNNLPQMYQEYGTFYFEIYKAYEEKKKSIQSTLSTLKKKIKQHNEARNTEEIKENVATLNKTINLHKEKQEFLKNTIKYKEEKPILSEDDKKYLKFIIKTSNVTQKVQALPGKLNIKNREPLELQSEIQAKLEGSKYDSTITEDKKKLFDLIMGSIQEDIASLERSIKQQYEIPQSKKQFIISESELTKMNNEIKKYEEELSKLETDFQEASNKACNEYMKKKEIEIAQTLYQHSKVHSGYSSYKEEIFRSIIHQVYREKHQDYNQMIAQRKQEHRAELERVNKNLKKENLENKAIHDKGDEEEIAYKKNLYSKETPTIFNNYTDFSKFVDSFVEDFINNQENEKLPVEVVIDFCTALETIIDSENNVYMEYLRDSESPSFEEHYRRVASSQRILGNFKLQLYKIDATEKLKRKSHKNILETRGLLHKQEIILLNNREQENRRTIIAKILKMSRSNIQGRIKAVKQKILKILNFAQTGNLQDMLKVWEKNSVIIEDLIDDLTSVSKKISPETSDEKILKILNSVKELVSKKDTECTVIDELTREAKNIEVNEMNEKNEMNFIKQIKRLVYTDTKNLKDINFILKTLPNKEIIAGHLKRLDKHKLTLDGKGYYQQKERFEALKLKQIAKINKLHNKICKSTNIRNNISSEQLERQITLCLTMLESLETNNIQSINNITQTILREEVTKSFKTYKNLLPMILRISQKVQSQTNPKIKTLYSSIITQLRSASELHFKKYCSDYKRINQITQQKDSILLGLNAGTNNNQRLPALNSNERCAPASTNNQISRARHSGQEVC